MSKPVPTTPEEIEWFTNHMIESLGEVKTKDELSNLWINNVNSIKALPELKRAQVVAKKDEVKKKFF